MSQELGTTNNPTDLIPGNPSQIHDTVRALNTYGHTLENIGQGIKTIDDGGWTGAAADAFRARFQSQPTRWLQAADAFMSAAGFFDGYATTLEWAQGQAVEAIAKWNEAQAVSTIIPAQQSICTDPGNAIHEAAREILNNARAQLSQVGHQCAAAVNVAGDLAPSPTVVDDVGSVFRGASDTVASAFSLLNPLNWPKAITGVEQFAQTAVTDSEQALKDFFDVNALQTDPAQWLGETLASEFIPLLGKLAQIAKVSNHLQIHVFEGEVKASKIVGYHSRPGGKDTGNLRVIKITRKPDKNGVYKAEFEGVTSSGQKVIKESSFFPDSWSQNDVADAIQQAFNNRQPVIGSNGAVIPGKWKGTYNGIRIEGWLSKGAIDAGVNLNTAKLYDVATAYPIWTGQ
jgi:uncharacterized protein YukE